MRFAKLVILLVFLNLFSASANAGYFATSEETCSTLDLRPKDSSMNIRHQSHLSWCYAYTASDFLQFHYKLSEPVSAMDVAITYGYSYFVPRAIEWVRNIIAYRKEARGVMVIDPPMQGILRDAMKKIVEIGYCPESVLPSDAWEKVDPARGFSQMIEARQAIRDSVFLSELIHKKAITKASDLPFYYAIPNVSKEQYFDLLASTTHKTFLPSLQSLVCDGKRVSIFSNPREEKQKLRLRGKRVFQRINSSLDRNDAVGIDFYSFMFINPKQYRKTLPSMHTVLIMGREYDSEAKECRYLIRDTHGEDCLEHGSYMDGQPFDPDVRCNKGYLSIRESDIYGSLISYSYFDPLTPGGDAESVQSEDSRNPVDLE